MEYKTFDEVMGEVAKYVSVELYQELYTVIGRETQDAYEAGFEDGLADNDYGYDDGYKDGQNNRD